MASKGKKVRKKERVISWIVNCGVTLLSAFLIYYFALPAINIHSTGFWGMILVLGLVFGFTYTATDQLICKHKIEVVGGKGRVKDYAGFIVAGVALLAMIIGGISSARLFHAKTYASIITVENGEFKNDMPETTSVTNIALMDTASARVIGNRTLGSLAQVVSQYYVNDSYSQINYQNTPKKVAILEYADFFKWAKNRDAGIPGFVMVDPVGNSANYVEFATPVRYAESGRFGDDLMRKLRFSYPTKIFGGTYFEIDDAGHPYYIVSCMEANAGLFGAMDVAEVIIFNPCDGTSEIYDVSNVPAWVDIVYDGDLACEKYNWYGELSGGFWNSVFGNKDCKTTTDDYGYIVIDDDVWYFTGVTSVTSDESNIGFIITNARTGEYRFYEVGGAEEYSAMGAAEGEVQEKGYKASFPSLVNIAGQATYIMVLKDTGGLVKLYALVNVEQYSIVATGATQSEAIAAYRKLLARNGVENAGLEEEIPEVEITVAEVRIVTLEEAATVYITAQDGVVYKGTLNDDESLVLIREGDTLTIRYDETFIGGLRQIRTWNRR
ncbi:MAG: hypothetical protein IJM57_03170 [Lachnospiraceae bacterium]|nr:hypothetical protein [Lachnospiraceae bacterium]